MDQADAKGLAAPHFPQRVQVRCACIAGAELFPQQNGCFETVAEKADPSLKYLG